MRPADSSNLLSVIKGADTPTFLRMICTVRPTNSVTISQLNPATNQTAFAIMKTLFRSMLVLIVVVFSALWYASTHPKSHIATLVDAGKLHSRAVLGFLSVTRGLDGHWQTRDSSDPKVDLNLDFGIHSCAVIEHMPDGTSRHAKFTDQRNPPFGDGSVILTDGDRYLTVCPSGIVRLDIPDGPWTPFIDSAGRKQHKRKQKTIDLARVP